MNWRAIWAIMRKDLRVVLQNKGVVLPIILLPVILFVVLPLLVLALPAAMSNTGASSNDLQELLAMISPGLRAQLAGLDPDAAGAVFFLVYMLAPLFLIVPIMVSNVIAADSFVGEKERKTLEALVYTPTTDRELLFAKVLGAWIPGTLVGLGGFVAYTIVANIVALNVVGMLILPNTLWLLLAFFVGPAAAAFGLGVTVIASSRVNSFQEAYQIGSLVVLPIVMLVVGQAMGAFLLSNWLVAGLGLMLLIADAVVFYFASASFSRSALMARI